jgi:hypothetical protein
MGNTAMTRPIACCVCTEILEIESRTTSHSEAPEMLQAPDGVWIGFVKSEDGPRMIACCSEECVERLLVE